MKKLVTSMLLLSSLTVGAKDFGKQGTSWPVAEEGIVAMIKRRLASLDVHHHQRILADKARRSFERPLGVKLPQAVNSRFFLIDPSYVLQEDIKLPDGQLLYKIGTKINPLEHEQLTKKLIFIDGDKQSNVYWARHRINDEVILVNGSPAEVSKQLGKEVYFDQMKQFIKKFKITHLPAILEQQGQMIKITEIVVNG